MDKAKPISKRTPPIPNGADPIMAIDIQASVQGIAERPRAYRLSVRQFLKMANAGILPGDTRFELLGGRVIKQMTQNPPHSFTVTELVLSLRIVLPAGWLVREEKPTQLSDRWLPLPDVAVVAGSNRRYEGAIPTVADIALLVEVSDTSYATDRGYKWRKYADVGVPIYWIVNLAKRQVEVYRQPSGTGSKAAYDSVEIYGEDTAVPVIIGGEEVGRLAVADLLPSAPAEGA